MVHVGWMYTYSTKWTWEPYTDLTLDLGPRRPGPRHVVHIGHAAVH